MLAFPKCSSLQAIIFDPFRIDARSIFLLVENFCNDKSIDPKSLILAIPPSGKILKDAERKQFEIHRIKTDVQIAELIDNKE